MWLTKVEPVQLISGGDPERGIVRSPVRAVDVPHIYPQSEPAPAAAGRRQSVNDLVAEPVVAAGVQVAEPAGVVVPAANERLAPVQTALDHRPAGAVLEVSLAVDARRATLLPRHTVTIAAAVQTDDVDAVSGSARYSIRTVCTESSPSSYITAATTRTNSTLKVK